MPKKLIALIVTAIVITLVTIGYFTISSSGTDNPIEGPKIIALQPYDKYPAALVRLVKSTIEQKYGATVIILPNAPLPSSAWYQPRQRYIADSLLLDLKKKLPKNAIKIVGLTAYDISTRKGEIKNYGVMGLGFVGGKSCVVSSYRLHKHNASDRLFKERLTKIAIHEVGHTFGLDHCPTANCVMQDCRGTMVTVDTENPELCSNCRDKITIP